MKKPRKSILKGKNLRNVLKNKDFMYFLLCAILLTLIIVGQHFFDSDVIRDYIEVGMLTSVVVAFFLTSFAQRLSHMFVDHFEDITKLTDDYDMLTRMYSANTEMILCRNAEDAYNKQGRKTTCKRISYDLPGDTYRIPVGDVTLLRGRQVVICDDKNKKYTPPEFCKKHYAELFGAHNFSKTYNQITLRTDRVNEESGKVYISFSRSTYYDALVSNRAMDFKIDGLCVRDLYATAPFLPSLEKSLLSNHMGFNGMVETSDGKFIFVKRHNRVSIGKNTLQCSVAASLKAKYTLNSDGVITKEGIAKAIMLEIEDELALSQTEQFKFGKEYIFGDFSFDNNVLFFYRDLLEGGKPQFMFYAKINIPSESVIKAYRKKCGKHSLLKDGNHIICIDKNELRRVYLAPDEMVVRKKRYRAMPSAVATVVMLREAITRGLICKNVHEAYTLSKKGDQMSNEDALYIDDRFVAVIDGVTSKNPTPIAASMSGGRFASQTLCDLLAIMPNETQPEKMLKWLNDNLKRAIANSIFAKSAEPPSASLMLYDAHTKTVISYGDCQVFLNGKAHKQQKSDDARLAKIRADILQKALDRGVSCEDLLRNDIGRAEIQQSLLDYAAKCANAPEGGFPVLGRGEIVKDYIVLYTAAGNEQVVMASDGYPVLGETLLDSELALQRIIKRIPC